MTNDPRPIPKLSESDLLRFHAKVNKEPGQGPRGDCWEWADAGDKDGYGRLLVAGKQRKAHRLAHVVFIGPIPCGLQVLHHCDNPPCCNPAHLWSGTNADNNRDKIEKGRDVQIFGESWRVAHEGSIPRGDNHYTRRNPEMMQVGEQRPQSKLTDAKVREIRTKYASSKYTLQMLADEYGVVFQTISRAVLRQSWKHVA